MRILYKIPTLKRSVIHASVMLTVYMCSLTSVNAVNDESLEEFGDVMQFALPAIGLGATAYYKDKEGAKQWAYSTVLSCLP